MNGQPHTEDFSQPRDLACRAADAAITAAESALAEAGAELERMFVLVLADNVPAGEPNACTAGHGIEDARDLLSFVMTHLIEAGERVGLRIMVAPLAEG